MNILFFIRLWRPLQTKADLSAGLALPPHICEFLAVEIATCSCPSITIQLSKNFQSSFEGRNPRSALATELQEAIFALRDDWLLCFDVWWAWVDSNYRPHPYQGCALTN
jgi:hypothetical protein